MANGGVAIANYPVKGRKNLHDCFSLRCEIGPILHLYVYPSILVFGTNDIDDI